MRFKIYETHLFLYQSIRTFAALLGDYGCSSIGRVVVSKTIGWEFESLHPCRKNGKR